MTDEFGCDTGVHGRKENQGKGWVAKYDARENPQMDEPLNFALFGLARQQEFLDMKWREVDWDLPVLDLGPGNKIIPGAVRCEYPEYNFESPDFLPTAQTSTSFRFLSSDDVLDGKFGYTDAYSMYRCTLPYPDNSVGGIFAVNILEHLWDPRPIMEECARVLAPGCPLNIVVPHAHSVIYSQDLDHKKEFVLDSFKNWLNNQYWGPDRTALRLRVGTLFKFSIKEGNENIQCQLVKKFDSEG
ncbi:methyltransferase [Gordonia phage OtterstedtS21]|uniref:Methyltransferase n=1 Tax=Gordonia phage OtterstedtS21 TaxID=2927260 RepID=A0A9E7U3W4_9CAUD|nr:methyltransferase [Gordonia phage OtterstedtS21]